MSVNTIIIRSVGKDEGREGAATKKLKWFVSFALGTNYKIENEINNV